MASLQTIQTKLEKFLDVPSLELKNILVGANDIYFSFQEPTGTADLMQAAEIIKIGNKYITIDREGSELIGLQITFSTE